jgi:hypothetical protein
MATCHRIIIVIIVLFSDAWAAGQDFDDKHCNVFDVSAILTVYHWTIEVRLLTAGEEVSAKN